ncbi:unnamed protein product [Arabis nemorensis]|uniref:1-phosphatidylinositol 4-kinase n=1 Tax=Arabis nemorensis TaxID=586526 RepID=A0A565BM72_9BRAS|nr:unnamed protein product [Arabis nemorensis]
MRSLQRYIENKGSLEDSGPEGLPVEQVLKITILDIRVGNTDRHEGNILKRTDQNHKTVLVPIDHGYCFPEKFEEGSASIKTNK